MPRAATAPSRSPTLAYDSRKVGPGTLFFCVPGEKVDGHEFAAGRSRPGRRRWWSSGSCEVEVPQVVVADARAAMAPLAARFWGDPTAELRVVGVTGTNGKTTTAFLVREILEAAGIPCGLLGTVKQVVGGVEEEVERTTPEAIDLQATFRRMLEGGDRACAMEVSSHAMTLHRADAIHFEVALFTNLTQDHLDFHADMEDYFLAKRKLFEAGPGTAIVNVDDPYGAPPRRGIRVRHLLRRGRRGRLQRPRRHLRRRRRHASAVGELRAADRVCRGTSTSPTRWARSRRREAMGVDAETAAAGLARAARVPGRFEPIDEGQGFAVLVDYAHTPDSLENVLRAARRLTAGRLISVFGAGGDRDRDKRPKMGRAGAELSDLAVVTSDNPRSEDPEAIVAEVAAGAEAAAPRSRSRSTAAPRSPWRWAGPSPATPS